MTGLRDREACKRAAGRRERRLSLHHKSQNSKPRLSSSVLKNRRMLTALNTGA